MVLTCADITRLPHVILQAVANDSDKGQNAELEYSLRIDNETMGVHLSSSSSADNKTVPEAPWFEIEPRSGEISLVAVEEMSSRCQSEQKVKRKDLGSYNLIITVTDKGEKRLSATATVEVRFTTSDQDSVDSVSWPDREFGLATAEVIE